MDALYGTVTLMFNHDAVLARAKSCALHDACDHNPCPTRGIFASNERRNFYALRLP